MTDMQDMIDWAKVQLDQDEQWARAANQAYRYAESAIPPETGVHWTWVKGEDWAPTTPDPVTEEFVGDATGEWGVNLATVEQWPSRITPSSRPLMMRKTYAGTIEEMDPSAAGHITRWDPARVLSLTRGLRRMLNQFSGEARETHILIGLVQALYGDRDGYREEWR